MIPTKLENWTYDIISELIKKNINESDMHDFKTELPDSETLTKICCAYANSKGGFIILGVKEKKTYFEITGIDNDKELAHNFGQKLKANPTIDFRLPKIISVPDSDKIIAIFEIPYSSESPHVPENSPNKRLFYKRTNKGNDFMTYDEIKFSFQKLQEKKEKLKLLYLELIYNIEILQSMKQAKERMVHHFSLSTLDDGIINSLLTEVYSFISNNKDLIDLLFLIRMNIKEINNKIKLFITERSVQIYKGDLTRMHNTFINEKTDKLIPVFEKAAKIIEDKYKIKY